MSLEVAFMRLPEIVKAIHEANRKLVKKAALDIQALAAANAPVDTGFLKSSIYTVTQDSSNYGQTADAPPQGAALLPEVEKPGDLEAVVAVGASYGVYVEYGTSNAPAQPYLTPAADAVQPAFISAAQALEIALKQAGF